MTGNEGRKERFERLYVELAPRVSAYCARRIGWEDAREVLAETFMIAWRKLDAVPDDAALPWLLATARRVLANRYRHARPRVAQDEVTVPDHAADVAVRLDLGSAFARLSAADQETLTLVSWDGLSMAEAARVVGCSPGAFAVRLHRARARLRADLDDAAHVGGTR